MPKQEANQRFFPRKNIDAQVRAVNDILESQNYDFEPVERYVEGISIPNKWGKYQYPIKTEGKDGYLVSDFMFTVHDKKTKKDIDFVFITINRKIKFNFKNKSVQVWDQENDTWQNWKPQILSIWKDSDTKDDHVLIILGKEIDNWSNHYLQKSPLNLYVTDLTDLRDLFKVILDNEKFDVVTNVNKDEEQIINNLHEDLSKKDAAFHERKPLKKAEDEKLVKKAAKGTNK